MQEIFDVSSVQNVVIVGERNIVAFSMVKTGILCFADTPICLMNDGYTWVFDRKGVAQLA